MSLGLLMLGFAVVVGCSDARKSVATEREGETGRENPSQLPIALLLGYEPSQRRMLRQAESLLITECMAERGFEYVQYPVDETDPFSLRELYGAITEEDASAFGYHNPQADKLRQDEALALARDSEVARQGPEYLAALEHGNDSCTSLALRRLYGDNVRPSESSAALEVLALGGEAQVRVAADARLGPAVKAWSQCMSEAGFSVSALSDSRMSFQSEPTDASAPSEEERRMAIADARCRESVRLDDLIATIYSEAFAALLDDRPELRAQLEEAFDTATAEALAVLGRTQPSE